MEHKNHNQDDGQESPDSTETPLDAGSDEGELPDGEKSRRPWEDVDLDEEDSFSESDRDSRNFYTFRNPDEESIF
jgi:hypothetical protein